MTVRGAIRLVEKPGVDVPRVKLSLSPTTCHSLAGFYQGRESARTRSIKSRSLETQ